MRKNTEDFELSDQFDEEGNLGSPAATDLLVVPAQIELDPDRDWLHWEVAPNQLRYASPPRNLLWDFIKLSDASPERIRAFARNWGVLELCDTHSLPADHPRRSAFSSDSKSKCRINHWLEGEKELAREPLSAWRRFAGEAKAMLNVAAALHEGEKGKRKDWEQVVWSLQLDSRVPAFKENLWWNLSVEEQKSWLAGQVTWWLRMGEVRPTLRWGRHSDDSDLGISIAFFSHGGLFGELAVQLMLAIGKSKGLAICSNCAAPYLPTRRPRADRRRYCQNCGPKAAPRDASRDRYERIRAKKKSSRR